MPAPSKLEILRQKLSTASDLGDPARYFFDHFAEDQAFIDSCKPTKDPMLTGVISQVVARILGEEARVSRVRLLRAPKQRITHGSFAAEMWIGAVLYVEDLAKGLVMLTSFSGGSLTHYNRFTVLKAPQGPNFMLN